MSNLVEKTTNPAPSNYRLCCKRQLRFAKNTIQFTTKIEQRKINQLFLKTLK